MMVAVQFNGKLAFVTIKINNVFSYGMLPPELPSLQLAVAKKCIVFVRLRFLSFLIFSHVHELKPLLRDADYRYVFEDPIL